MADTQKTVIFLFAVLLALVVAGAAVLFLLPEDSSNPEETPVPTGTLTTGLDTSILESTNYTQLDASLIQQGALPVKPPATTGKANPFL